MSDLLQWRQQVFERDDSTCQACLTKGGLLHVIAWVPSKKPTLSNCLTLCDDCHQLWATYTKHGLFKGRESLLQKHLIKGLRDIGFYVHKVTGTLYSTQGAPDLFVCCRGLAGGIEVKVYPNTLSVMQRINGERIKAAGGIFYVARSRDDIARIAKLFVKRADAFHSVASHQDLTGSA